MPEQHRELPAHEGVPQHAERGRASSRTCAVCGVKLSQYNPGPHCWQHTIGHPWRGPSAKPRF
jgi:hypothetical protein